MYEFVQEMHENDTERTLIAATGSQHR